MDRKVWYTAGCALLFLWGALAAGNNFQRNRGVDAYPDEVEHPGWELPPDADEKTEWVFARLRYPGSFPGYPGTYYLSWGIDAPRSDRHFVTGVRRLTRVHTRSVEQVVNLPGNEIYEYPWLYAVEVGHWSLNDEQAAKIREYLLRGGFLMTDDFHGSREWAVFMAGMQKIFPDRTPVDIDPKDPIFHVLYDNDDKIQVPGLAAMRGGRTYEQDGVRPEWKAIYDDKGRIMVAICHNQDNGDAWERADVPSYPEKYSAQAYRMGINYLIYSMSH